MATSTVGALDPVDPVTPPQVGTMDLDAPVVDIQPVKPVKPIRPVTFRKFDDIDGQRDAIYGNALEALQGKSVENDQFRVEIHDPHFRGTYAPTLREEKQAILGRGSLEQKLYGTVRLIDKQTGQLVEEQQTVLAHVPHLNQRGLFIRDGSIWLGRNQQRLRSGIYGRTAQDGTVQAQVNAQRGRGFQVALEPKTGLFKLNVGQSTTRLYPLLRGLGIPDQDLEAQWGPELFKKNWRPITGNDHKELQKVVGKLGGPKDALLEVAKLAPRLTEILGNTELDDQVTAKTMGRQVKNLQPRDLLDITGKVLRISRGEEEPDNRDSQAYQSTHSSEDFIRERLDRDRSGGLRNLLWKATKDRSLKRLSSGLLTPNIDGLFQGSGLFVGTEDTNPLEIHDLRHGLIRTGDGGMSAGSVSRDARDVQTSYLGFIDPSRTADSAAIGLDLRTTGAAVKGSDNRLYTPVRNVRTGATEMKPAIDLERSTVAFPGELARPGRMVRALSGGKLRYVPRTQVDWELPGVSSLLNPTTQVVPMPEGVKGQRLLMGTRMSTQAMPLEDPEAPLVQTADEQGGSVQHALGEVMGAVRAKQDGTVESVTPDEIVIRNQDGTRTVRQLFNNYTHSRKTMSHNDALVQAGDPVRAGQTLARSNYTDRDGTLALGKNLRVAYQFGKGKTFEDSWVISESAAKKLTSQHLYRQELGLDDIHTTKKGDYVAIYGGKFSPAQLKNLGNDGVIQEGQQVQTGDPLVLGVARKAKRAIGAVMQSPGSGFTDRSEVWDHKAPGVVTDVVRSKDGIRVTVKSYAASDLADKLSNRYGSKGVISEILPDDQMPHDEQGRPVEMLMNAAGVVSRVNPSALAETLLAKVARKTGKPYLMKPFGVPGGLADFALNEAKRHGVKELETLTDPVTGRKLPDVMVGEQYMMKLHHTAEGKLNARDTGAYDIMDAPARGGFEGSKRVGGLDIHSLISHGATEFLKDAKLIRGQRNDNYWRALRAGETPLEPAGSFASDHFRNLLRAAGVQFRSAGTRTSLAPMLDRDVDQFAHHEITSPETFDKNMRPIPGGLFDPKATGGADGRQWGVITLPRPIPHPLFEVPILKMLGITRKTLEGVMAGTDKLDGQTGPEAIQRALGNLDLPREQARLRGIVAAGAGSKRDDAVKALGYMKGLETSGVKPQDLMVTRIPVLPPKFRPITRTPKLDITHDLNYLYQDLLEAKQNYRDMHEASGQSGDQLLTLYRAARAISSMGDPVGEKSAQQGVKGALAFALGKGDDPKGSVFQRRVMGNSVDSVGRGVITAAPELDMDQIRIPREMAWNLYRPFAIRELVRNGKSAQEAVQAVQARTPVALATLRKVMGDRPVVYNRAPSLHRYSYAAGHPVLGPEGDDSIGINYVVEKGLASDHDGDSGRTMLTVRGGPLRWKTYQGASMSVSPMTKISTFNGPLLIQDLPVVEGSDEILSPTVTNYRVEPGVEIEAIDPATNQPGWFPVTHFSEHRNCETRMVELMGNGAETLLVTADHALICYRDGSLQPTRPDEAIDLLVPQVRRLEPDKLAATVTATGRSGSGTRTSDVVWKDQEETFALSRALGRFLGLLIGDGWIAVNHQICLSNNDPAVLVEFKRLVRELGIAEHITNTTYSAPSLGGKITERSRASVCNAWIGRWIREHIGTGALNKKLPEFTYGAPEEFLEGLVDGLFTTDGTISFGKAVAKTNPQLHVQYSTSSPDLVEGLKVVFRRLGIRASHSVGKSPTSGKPCFLVMPSAPEFCNWARRCQLKITHQVKAENLAKALATPIPPTSQRQIEANDMVPFPSHLGCLFTNAARQLGGNVSRIHGSSSNGRWSRANALEEVARVDRADPEGFEVLCGNRGNAVFSLDPVKAKADLNIYRALIQDTSIGWYTVKSSTPGEPMTCYDLTVPGPFTFATYTGVVIQDTINVHLPVSDKAAQEALEKMLPSKNLLAPGTGESHFEPQQDYVVGLHLASQVHDRKPPRVFETADQALKAYARGEISLSDPIRVLEH